MKVRNKLTLIIHLSQRRSDATNVKIKSQITNKIQFLITKIILINQFTIWSFVFDNYLRFEICDLLFGTLRLSAFARPARRDMNRSG
jgi:hypothetical protein